MTPPVATIAAPRCRCRKLICGHVAALLEALEIVGPTIRDALPADVRHRDWAAIEILIQGVRP